MDKTEFQNQIRYAERLCQRTARLYRHLQASSVFMTVLGGSAVVASMSDGFPHLVTIAGATVFTVFGALNLSIRPADKAAINENDARRYAQLRTASISMSAVELESALSKAREIDAQEVDALREVAYNDVVQEIGRPDEAIDLSIHQKLLKAIA